MATSDVSKIIDAKPIKVGEDAASDEFVVNINGKQILNFPFEKAEDVLNSFPIKKCERLFI